MTRRDMLAVDDSRLERRGREGVVEQIDRLVQDAYQYQSAFREEWDRNLQIWEGQHFTKAPLPGHLQYVVDLTSVAIIAHVAAQLNITPVVEIKPRETTDRAVTFLSDSGAKKMKAMASSGAVAISGFTTPQLDGEEPLSDEQAELVKPLVEQGVLAEEDLHLINDATAAEAIETVHAIWWDRADTDFVLLENVHNRDIIGHQPTLVQYDDDLKCDELENVHVKTVFIDRFATDVSNASYVVFDRVLPEDRAMALYPEHRATIERAASEGGDDYMLQFSHGARFDGADQRRMVTIRTAWLRHHRFPVPVSKAVARGLVVKGQQPVLENGQPVFDVATEQVLMEWDGAYYLPDGKPVVPPDDEGRGASPDWPDEPGIRQVQMIADEVLDDRRCKYVDIPIAWNKAGHRPYCPYGMGEPKRAWPLQENINRIATAIGNNIRMAAQPEQAMPESVYNDSRRVGALHARVNRIIKVKDKLWSQFRGQIKTNIEAPRFDAAMVEAYREFKGDLSQILGHTNALKGIPDSADMSGAAIKQLQQAALGVLSLKSKQTERYIRHITALRLGMIRDFLTVSDLSRMSGKFPPHVWRAIRGWWKDMEFDIVVEVSSGRGVSRTDEQRQAREDFAAKLVSHETTLKKIGVPDPKAEAKRMADERQKQAVPDGAVQPFSAGALPAE